ncbi:MAG TPA: hypothetical protein VK524_25190 [Polyangiaceae bacterium]|nr:hypothetical protein [Polyangiaceae bacterium]
MNPQERIAILERLLDRVKRKGPPVRSGVVAGVSAPEPARSAALQPTPARAAAPEPTPAPAVAAPAPPPAPAAQTPQPVPAAAAAVRSPSEPASGEWAVPALASAAPDRYAQDASAESPLSDADVQELELSDEELVDITVEEGEAEAPPSVAARAPSSADIEIDMEEDEEEAPVSSRRARVAGSMDEALAGAAEQLDQDPEREVPLKTPPPESGPQAALPLPPGLEQPPLPTEYDSGVHPAEDVKVGLPAAGPTHAQLGQTIELEEPHGPDLELDMRSKVPAPELEPAEDELEAALPDASVERMRPAPASLPAEEIEPERTGRPLVHSDVAPASFSRAARPFAPSTFAELLDASLALGRD